MGAFEKTARPALWGLGYAFAVILLSRLLLRCLGGIIGLFGTDLSQVAQAAGQLRNAVLVSPWLMGLLTGGLIGNLLRIAFRKPGTLRRVSIWSGSLLLIPLVLLCLCFTRVNGICVLDLLRTVLPILL